MSYDKYYRVWADVDLGAIRSNIEKIKERLSSGTKICSVIKADAYGHGAVKTAHAIEPLSDFFAVATMDEAMELRNSGIEIPILILGYVHPSCALYAAQNDIRLTVFDAENSKLLSDAVSGSGKKLKIHIKTDTGMSRIGFAPVKESAEDILAIHSMPGIEIEGIFTHFAKADEDTTDDALAQLAVFRDFTEKLKEAGIDIRIRHCANSAAATKIREADMDMVRLGISIYGMYPSEYVHDVKLEPALSLHSHVVMVKEVKAGTAVGYGGTWQAEKDSMIATIPVGYADGYHRLLSNKGSVLIKGKKYPVVGRVCMDQIMVDVTETPDNGRVEAGNEVILIGRSENAVISAEEVADIAQTINYEITCSLSSRVPRRYIHFN